jgi:hypothetical protein
MIVAVNGTLNYTDDRDVSQDIDIRLALTGQNKIVSSMYSGGGSGAIGIPLGAGSKGAKQVNSITFPTPPGGLFSIYLIKQFGGVISYDPALNAERPYAERDYLMQGGAMPRIYDGAWLGFFFMPNGGSRSVAMNGNATFVWD